MKRIISLIAFILMLTAAELQAQTVIKGNVTDTSGEPLLNVSVLVHNAGSNLRHENPVSGIQISTPVVKQDIVFPGSQ